jgi:hypothetical protein
MKWCVVFDFIEFYKHEYAIETFTTNRFVSRMELGPRSPRNSFGAARQTSPFDRVNSDM